MRQCLWPPTVLASNQTQPIALAIDATNVYWVDKGSPGAVMQVPKVGGTPIALATNEDGANTVAVDSGFVYWGHVAGTGPNVSRVPIGGGATFAITTADTYGLAVDASYVYFSSANRVIARAPKGGGSAMPLATGHFAEQIAVDGTSLYWMEQSISSILSVPLGGGAASTLATGFSPLAIAIDAVNVYTTAWDGAVRKFALTGGPVTTITAAPTRMVAIAVGPGFVYWSDDSNMTIMKAPIGGGPPQLLAANQQSPGALAVDSTRVYWVNVTGGTVMSVPK
jgi:hypothetical protein